MKCLGSGLEGCDGIGGTSRQEEWRGLLMRWQGAAGSVITVQPPGTPGDFKVYPGPVAFPR